MAHPHDDDAVAGGDSGPIGFVTGMLGAAGMVEAYGQAEAGPAPGQETRPETPLKGPFVFRKFFRAVDMADTSRWKRLPAEFDRHQAEALS